jgi:hypothetical protein
MIIDRIEKKIAEEVGKLRAEVKRERRPGSRAAAELAAEAKRTKLTAVVLS